MDEAENKSTVKTNVCTSPPQSEGRSPSQTSEPACSTSCEAGESPSAPRAPGNSKHRGCYPGHRTSQDGAPPQTPNLLGTSPQQVSLASCLGSGQLRTNCCVSCDHRPPTSTPNTTKRALRSWPIISRYVRSFRRRASHNATRQSNQLSVWRCHPLPIVRHRRGTSHPPPLPVSGHPPRLVGSNPSL